MSTVANLYSNSFAFYTNSSSINESSDTISIANANTYLSANDQIKYIVPDGSSPISGLDSNNAYYVTFANSSTIALSLTKSGPNVSISPTEENDTNYIYKFSNTNALTLAPDGTISFAVFDSANDLNVSYSSTKIKISHDSDDPLVVANSSSNVLVVKANGNVLISKGIIANNSLGSSNQVLTSNGSGVYWSSSTSGGGNGTVTSVSSGNGLSGGPITTTGTLSVLANNGITTNATGVYVTQGTGVVVNATGVHINSTYIGTLSANNTTYVNGKTEGNLNVNNATTVGGNTASTLRTYSETTASNAYTNAVSFASNASNITSGTLPYAQIPANIINTTANFTISGVHTHNANVVLGTSGLSANSSYGTAGQVLHSNGTATYWAADDQGVTSVSSGSGLSGGPITTTGTLSVLANTGIVANATGVYVNATYIGTLSANNTTYVNGKTEANLNVNSAVYATNAVNANNADYLDGQHGSYYTNATNISTGTLAEARLPYRMNQNVTTSNDVTFGSLTLTGNLTVSGNVTVIGANNLSVVDNMIYLNSNNTTDNEDIGIVGNYNTTGNSLGYAHTGIFRDASDGYWKVFDGYKPEPDANVNIDTTNTTFQLANFQANLYAAGNTSTNWFVANTSGAYHTGLVNAASHTVGTSFTANSTVTNTVSLVVSTNTATIGTGTYFVSNGNVGIGNTTPTNKLSVNGTTYFQSNVTLNSGLIANGSIGTAGHVLHSNGTATYWAADDTGGGTITSISTGNGLTGGPITSSGTISALANTGIVANATGLYVNASYIATIASNSANYANGSISNTFTIGTGTYFVSNGNVGIGTTTPASKLQVVGTSWIGGSNNSQSAIAIYSQSATAAVIEAFDPTNSATKRDIGISAFGGNVGIGTQSPSQKLTVSGIGNATTDFRAPIFYDSDDTGYYVNPNSTSKFYDIWTNAGYIYFQTTQHKRITSNDGGGNWNFRAGNYMNTTLQYINNGANSGAATLSFTCDGTDGYISLLCAPIGVAGANVSYTGSAGLDRYGTFGASGDLRAPRYYDSDNTAYYIDGAGASVLTRISLFSGTTSALHVNDVSGAASFNYIMSAANDTGNKLVAFVNGSTRNTDGGNNAVTFRNDGGPFVLGSASYVTTIAGSNVGVGLLSPSSKLHVQGTAGAVSDNGMFEFGDSSRNGISFGYNTSLNEGWIYARSVGTAGRTINLGAGGLYVYNASYAYSPYSFRAPQFYDSDNTGFYIDAASSSRLSVIYSDQYRILNGGVFIWQHNSAGADNKHWDTYSGSDGTLNFRTVNDAYTAANNWLTVTRSGNAPQVITLGATYTTAAGSLRAPIFYDSDNTAYYANLAGSSYLETLSVASGFVVRRQNTTTEGGEFYLEKANNSTLSGNVTIDTVGSIVRIFEGGGTARGGYLDLASCAASAASILLHTSNYNSYAPTLTGTGASGTWNITANNATNFAGLSSSSYVQRYGIPNTGAATGWVNLGTFACSQDGDVLKIKIYATTGYNANINQNQITEIFFKTSNGTSNTAGFLGDAYAHTFGPQTNSPTTIRIVQSSSTSYVVHANFATYSGTSFYEIAHNGTSWTHSGTNNGATAPTGTYIDVTKYKIWTELSDGAGSGLDADLLDGQQGAYYTNATNITTGTLPYAQIPANVINTTAAFTRSGITTFSANVVMGSSGLSSNGSFGTAGQVLHSNGTATYWAADDVGVTSVATSSGLTGGTITSTGTISVLANNGITANATGLYVTQGTGTVVNATGVHVNSTYIGTISANNATFFNTYSSTTFAAALRSNRNLNGGGTITVNASYSVLWSARFLVIANGRGTNFSTTGYYDITCPTSGTITGVGGATSVTATAAGVPLAAWTALYYILPIGSGNATVAANFRVATFTGDVDIPAEWVLIAIRNGDDGMVYFNNGMRLSASQTEDASKTTGNVVSASALTGGISALTFDKYGRITAATGSANYVANTSSPTFTNLCIGSGAPLTAAGYGWASANGSTGGIFSSSVNGTEQFRIQTTSSSTTVNNITAIPLLLSANNAEVMRVTANARVAVNNGTPGAKFVVTNGTAGLTSVATQGVAGNLTLDFNGGGGHFYDAGGHYFRNFAGTTLATIGAALTGTGNRLVYSDANGQLTNTASDLTLKTNIQPISHGLDAILQLNPIAFNWKDHVRFGKQREIGFGAQEVQQVIPEVIGINSDDTLSLDYPKLTSALTKAIQELSAKLDKLQNEFDDYKNNHP